MSEPHIDSVFDVTTCLERVRCDDQSAARALVDHLYPLVIKIVRSHLPRRLDEEDLAQEVFMKVFAKLDDYRGDAPFEHWVARLSRNTCLNQLRGEKARPEWRFADLSEDHLAVIEALPGPADAAHPLDATTSNEVVEMLMDGLAPQDRMILQLLELEDLSVEEISRRTGWSRTLIRVRAFRARGQLRKRLSALHEKKAIL